MHTQLLEQLLLYSYGITCHCVRMNHVSLHVISCFILCHLPEERCELVQIYHVILSVVKQRCFLGVLFSKTSYSKLTFLWSLFQLKQLMLFIKHTSLT